MLRSVKEAPDPPVVPLRFTAAQFERMEKAGVLPLDQRFELLDGQIIPMLPPGPDHCFHVDSLAAFLITQLGGAYHVRSQGNILLSRYSEPQPDFAILRRDDAAYRKRHPGPDDILLLIEVSDTTLAFDKNRKATAYSAAGIVEYWIINLRQRKVHVFRKPGPDGYQELLTCEGEEAILPVSLPGFRVKVNQILMPAI